MAENKGKIIGNCSADRPRTGQGNCPKAEGKTVALLLTGMNALYPMDKAQFIAALNGYVTDTGRLNMLPIKTVVGMPITGGDIATSDLGTYGGSVPVNVNPISIAYQIDAGDCFFKEIIKLKGQKVRIFRVDDTGFIYGTVVTRGDQDYFAGFEATLYPTRVPTDGSTPYNLSLTAYYGVNHEIEVANLNAFDVGLGNIPDGLVGLILQNETTTGAATVIEACGGVDITSDFSENWTAEMFLNEAGANPTTVTYADGVLTFAPAAAYRVAPASVLAAGDITGYDGVEDFVTIS